MLTRLRSLEQLMPFATAGELLMQKRRSVVVAHGTTAVAAPREMEEKDIALLPVVEAGKLVGVIAERDIVRGVILHSRTPVRDIMTTDVQTVAPETTVPDCLTIMYRAPHPPSSGNGGGARRRRPVGTRFHGLAHRAARAPAAQAARRARDTAISLTEQLLSLPR
jgi:CBS domain-containing protein